MSDSYKRNTKVKKWFDNAAEEDLQQIVVDYRSMDDDTFEATYKFTKSGARPYLEGRELIESKHRRSRATIHKSYCDTEEFRINFNLARESKKSRSFQICESVATDIDAFMENYPGVDKYLIFNELLRFALDRFTTND